MNSDISDDRYLISAGTLPHKEVFTAMAQPKPQPPYNHASPWMTEIVLADGSAQKPHSQAAGYHQ